MNAKLLIIIFILCLYGKFILFDVIKYIDNKEYIKKVANNEKM